ncbi:hypothetical protein AVEN_135526-1 [Araneus ventricosus]|uniref:Uncharacterized protein n=1 Tax=Araneus ventricosus TaxID=182803 RepID=A0A4Y2HEB1_ARAVE|nr:hypothetical protein AVEN_135526-1 [Araneus ventricosus]
MSLRIVVVTLCIIGLSSPGSSVLRQGMTWLNTHESEEEGYGFYHLAVLLTNIILKLVDRFSVQQRIAFCEQADCWMFSFNVNIDVDQFPLKIFQEDNLPHI